MNEIDTGASPLLTLVPLSVLAGFAVTIVFTRLTDGVAMRRITNRMIARAMEFRLFIDEPALVLRAQGQLFIENARLLKTIAVPTLIVSLACILLYPHLDGLYGYAPLPLNEPAVITARFNTMPGAAPALRSDSQALAIETPGLRALASNEVSWRIRPLAASVGEVQVLAPEGPQSKRVVAGGRAAYLVPLRGSSWLIGLVHPFEPPLSGGGLEAIEIAYPPQTILGFAWPVWFFGIMSLAAFLALPVIT